MKKLEEKELEKITGGVSPWLIVGLVGLVVFLAGVVEGLVNPKACDAS